MATIDEIKLKLEKLKALFDQIMTIIMDNLEKSGPEVKDAAQDVVDELKELVTDIGEDIAALPHVEHHE